MIDRSVTASVDFFFVDATHLTATRYPSSMRLFG